MTEQKRNSKTLEEQLEELKVQIGDIVNRLETAAEKEAEALKPKLKAAQEKLNELGRTSSEAWDELRPGLGRAWDELQKSFTQAASKFKTRTPKE